MSKAKQSKLCQCDVYKSAGPFCVRTYIAQMLCQCDVRTVNIRINKHTSKLLISILFFLAVHFRCSDDVLRPKEEQEQLFGKKDSIFQTLPFSQMLLKVFSIASSSARQRAVWRRKNFEVALPTSSRIARFHLFVHYCQKKAFSQNEQFWARLGETSLDQSSYFLPNKPDPI